MSELYERLTLRAADFPGEVDAQASLPRVLGRARRRQAGRRGVALAGGFVLLASAAVAAPGLLERSPDRPEILAPPTVEEREEPEVDDPTTAPATEASAPTPPPAEEAIVPPQHADEGSDEPPPPAETIEFTAHQAHDVVDGEPPTNVYWGTASPGDEVWVWSEYGEATTHANENGEWEVTVTFADAPAGQKTFPVKAKHGDERVDFELTTIRAEDPGHVEFTAHQAHDVVDGEPPTNVYWGTASPGDEVWVWSEYGEATTHANENGEWEVVVTFADAPGGQTTFVVKAGPRRSPSRRTRPTASATPSRPSTSSTGPQLRARRSA